MMQYTLLFFVLSAVFSEITAVRGRQVDCTVAVLFGCILDDHCCSRESGGNYLCRPRTRCKSVGQNCNNNNQCCSKVCGSNLRCQSVRILPPAPRPPVNPQPDVDKPCILQGHECNNNNQCCSKVCGSNSRCQSGRILPPAPRPPVNPQPDVEKPCILQGHECDINDQCCNKVCKNGYCAPVFIPTPRPMPPINPVGPGTIIPPHACRSSGEECDRNEDCCNKVCAYTGYCSTCKTSGEKCDEHSQCCNRACGKDGYCRTCKNNGEKCKNDDQCCNNACAYGYCLPNVHNFQNPKLLINPKRSGEIIHPQPCKRNGDECNENHQCCFPYICGERYRCVPLILNPRPFIPMFNMDDMDRPLSAAKLCSKYEQQCEKDGDCCSDLVCDYYNDFKCKYHRKYSYEKEVIID